MSHNCNFDNDAGVCPCCGRSLHYLPREVRSHVRHNCISAEERRARITRIALPSPIGSISPHSIGSLSCIHRGPRTREVVCPTCGGNKTRLKVFACALHGECALARINGVRFCGACQDVKLPEA